MSADGSEAKGRREPTPAGLRARGLRAALAALGRLPVGPAYALADALVPAVVLALLLHELRVAPRGRGLLRNLRIAYRRQLDLPLAARRIVGFGRHLARLAVDLARLPRLSPSELARCVEIPDLPRLAALVREGRGLLCVTGHIGVWELASLAPAARGVPITVVARSRSDAGLEAALHAGRRASGQRVLPQRGALWPLVRALRGGGVVGLVADEDTARDPVFAPFLGTPAATHAGPAFLARVTGAPIAVMACHRVGVGRFRLGCFGVVRVPRGPDRAADLRAGTEALNCALSAAIRAQPDQWLWGSRRFRTRPPGEAPGLDGLPSPGPGDCSAGLGEGAGPHGRKS